MQINFQKNSEGEFIIFFEDQAINLEFSFQLADELEIETIVQFKGILHSKTLRTATLSKTVVLDKAGVLSLSYQEGDFWVKMEKDDTRMVLPIGKEVYSRVDYLLDQLICTEN